MTGAIAHLCARCGAPTQGMPVGGRCASCTRELERRAARLGRAGALVTTVLLAAYLALRLRSVAPAWIGRARVVSAVAVVVWYWLTSRIVKRIALEWLK